MTIHSKANPVGLDLQLLRIQRKLDAIGWTNMDVYGKLYINERDGSKVAEAYIGSGEYKEVFVDDTKTCVMGFMVDETRDGLSMIKCGVKLLVSMRLDKVYDSAERMDEEALLTVHKVLKPLILSPNMGEIKTGLANVFSDVSYEKFKYRDLQPWFNFSISFDLVYRNET